ncbi:MAG: Fic family protein [Saprospiraceae bacterium]
MTYNWQQPDWGQFTFDAHALEEVLTAYLEASSRLLGMLKALPASVAMEFNVETIAREALGSSATDGEVLDSRNVLAAIRNKLGLNSKPENVHDLRAIGLCEMLVDARKSFEQPLSASLLFKWHRQLLSYRQDLASVGHWRQGKEAVAILSGPIARQRKHFEAPPSFRVPPMMDQFIQWFNSSSEWPAMQKRGAAIRAAIAHLYFESIHPFESGNGRIGRALAEKALAQGLGLPAPFSLSKTIASDREGYFRALEKAQRKNELTSWVQYFATSLLKAISDAEHLAAFIVSKTRFLEKYSANLNERQLYVVHKMLEEGNDEAGIGMNARRYCSITGASKATATRDLQMLHRIGALKQHGSGRSTGYSLNIGLQGDL